MGLQVIMQLIQLTKKVGVLGYRDIGISINKSYIHNIHKLVLIVLHMAKKRHPG